MTENEPQTVDFVTFILSLASSVQIHLGLVDNPETHQKNKNLELAKQAIDILVLLQEKTKGNLSENETKLFDYLLFVFRMKYVEVWK